MERVYAVLPAEAQDWARKMGIPQPPMEVENPDVHDGADPEGRPAPAQAMAMARDGGGLVITSPESNSVFAIASDLPLSAQRREVAARTKEAIAIREVTHYVDEQPLGNWSNPPYRTMWQLSEGDHAIRAVGRDLDGHRWESPSVQITVVEE